MKSRKKGDQDQIYPAKEKKKVKEKWNLVPWIIIGAALLVIFGGIWLAPKISDGISYLKLQKLVSTDSGYYDEKKGVTYTYVPSYYEATLIVSDPAYGRVDDLSLYRVGYRDDDDVVHLVKSTSWLATDADHGSILVCNEEEATIPKPQDFDFETVYICNTGSTVFTEQELDNGTSADIMNAFFDESSENLYGSLMMEQASLLKSIRVTSSSYPWLQMVLYLYADMDSDGNNLYYLYLPTLNRFVQTDTEVFDLYFAATSEILS
jgi:hypothetical protein